MYIPSDRLNEADLAFIDVVVADKSRTGAGSSTADVAPFADVPPFADVVPFADVAWVKDADVAEVSFGRGAVGRMVGVGLGRVVLTRLLFEVGPVISSYSAA